MDVEVEHGLRGAWSVSLRQVDAVGLDRLANGGGDLLGGTGDRAEQIGRDLVEIAPMLLGDGEGVALVGRIDVHEGERRLVFVKLEARDGARDDRSEERRVGKECTARESATRCRKK